jgi:hypothetical protein
MRALHLTACDLLTELCRASEIAVWHQPQLVANQLSASLFLIFVLQAAVFCRRWSLLNHIQYNAIHS